MGQKVNSNTALAAVSTAWTPALTLQTPGTSNFSYTTQNGVYVKLGSLIVANFQISVTITLGTGSGGIFLSGLPAEIAASAPLNGFIGQYTNITLPAGYTQLGLWVFGVSGLTKCSLVASGSAQTGASALLSASALGSGCLLSGCVIYQTDI